MKQIRKDLSNEVRKSPKVHKAGCTVHIRFDIGVCNSDIPNFRGGLVRDFSDGLGNPFT